MKSLDGIQLELQRHAGPVSACTMCPSEFTKIITSLLLVHACFLSENPAVLFSNPFGSKSSLPPHLRVDFWWKKHLFIIPAGFSSRNSDMWRHATCITCNDLAHPDMWRHIHPPESIDPSTIQASQLPSQPWWPGENPAFGWWKKNLGK